MKGRKGRGGIQEEEERKGEEDGRERKLTGGDGEGGRVCKTLEEGGENKRGVRRSLPWKANLLNIERISLTWGQHRKARRGPKWKWSNTALLPRSCQRGLCGKRKIVKED